MKKHKVIGKRLVVAVAMAMACGTGVGMANAATKDIALVEGWNLVNTPLEPTAPEVDTVLAGVSSTYVSAWVWNASTGNWMVRLAGETGGDIGAYATSKGFLKLGKLHAGQGFWLNMKAPETLNITGTAPTTTTNSLGKGWNLVGARTDASQTLAQAIAALGTEKPLSMWAWQGGKWAVALPYTSAGTAVEDLGASYATSKGFTLLAELPSTSGYWVNANVASAVFTPPDSGPGVPVEAVSDEACMVCHTTGKIANLDTVAHQVNAVNTVVNNMAVKNVGGVPVVSFHVEDAKGNPIQANAYGRFTIMFADLVPAGTSVDVGTEAAPLAVTYPTDYYKRWLSFTINSATASTLVGLDTSDAANGNYTYTFQGTNTFALLGSKPAGYAAYGNLEYTSLTHKQRLGIEFRALVETSYNRGGGFMDFDGVPPSGATIAEAVAATKIDNQRMFVTVEACQKCHGPNMLGAAHASSHIGTLGCVMCHSPYYSDEMRLEGVQLSVFIHKIHAAMDVEAFPTRIRGKGYVDVTYPQEVENCVVCHTISGKTLGTGDLIDNWKNHPTKEVCKSCHTTVDFVAKASFVGLDGLTKTHVIQPTEAACNLCHDADTMTLDHALTPDVKDVPEYDVALAITPPAAGTFYKAGEKFTITATLKNHATGLDVDPTFYAAQTASDPKGVANGLLNAATLYVYGPRSNALPLIKVIGSNGLLTQTISLFGKGDTTGFHYEVTVPADATSGTYIVRTKFADYGYVGATDYKLDSIAFTNIQIGTATVQKKVAGDCTKCHGTGLFGAHNARHSVHFDTDECLACHDQSGNHANMIANRVHAIHAASKDGDNLGKDWSAITYPMVSGVTSLTATPAVTKICVTCHDSGNTSYKSVILGTTCKGCHADNQDSMNHMLNEGL